MRPADTLVGGQITLATVQVAGKGEFNGRKSDSLAIKQEPCQPGKLDGSADTAVC
jgi:hypothetical protein